MAERVMGKIVQEFTDLEILWDYQLVADIEELIGEGCPFNAPHINVLGQLFGKLISLVAGNDCVK